MARLKNANPEVDQYIADAAPFARPILKKLRRLFHEACPEIQEVIKWKCPHFEYRGLVGGMAAFKEHASFSFSKGKLLSDPYHLFDGVGKSSMCAVGLTDVSQLPPDEVLLAYIREAVSLNEKGKRVPKPRTPPRPPLDPPADLLMALKKNKKALATFESFSPSHRRDYIAWIMEAKRDETRQKRIATTLEWLTEGKPRNWKYQ